MAEGPTEVPGLRGPLFIPAGLESELVSLSPLQLSGCLLSASDPSGRDTVWIANCHTEEMQYLHAYMLPVSRTQTA